MPTTSDLLHCPSCERKLVGQHNFCPFCGHDLRTKPRVPPPVRDGGATERQGTEGTGTQPAPPRPPQPVPERRTVPEPIVRKRGFRLFNLRTLFGIMGLLELPVIAILAFLLFRPSIIKSPPTTACDDIQVEAFVEPRFESGLGGELDEDTVFLADGHYLVQEILVVPQNQRLLIEPGARLLFEEEAGIDIRGSLYVCGSDKAPVTFTAEAGQPGSWRGLRFINAKDDSALRHALIQFAGDRAVDLENSAPIFHDVEIANSQAFPVSADGNQLPETMVDVVLENNPFNGIEIRGGAKEDKQNIRWPNHGLVYVVSGMVEIGDNTTLAIDQGTTVKFWRGGRDRPGIRVLGLLKAEQVQFTSVYDSRDAVGGTTYVEARDPAPGDWGGLTFDESSGKTILKDVLIQYAGLDQGAIHMRATSPELDGVTIADSAWYPLSADADSFPTLNNLTLRGNEPGDAMEIRGDSTISARQEHTWSVLGDETQIVRVIRGQVVVAQEATLIIEPGVVVKFEPGSRLIVQGVLRAVADSDEQIIFTSLRDDDFGGKTDKNTGPQDARSWDGLIFDQADENSLVQNTIVRYAPIVLRNASPQLIDNIIRDSTTAAIWATPNANPTMSGNKLEDNELDGMAIAEGVIDQDQTWRIIENSDGQLVRILTDRIRIAEAAVLRIESGVVVKGDENGLLYVEGELRVRGEEDQPVIFTSLNDDGAVGDTNQKLREAGSGDWPGIEAAAKASLDFEHAIIRYARTGLRLRDGSRLQIGESLNITDGISALWCNGDIEVPARLVARGNQDNLHECPTQ